MKKIAILDGYTAVRDDLDWSALKSLGEVSAFDRTPPELVLERSRGAQIILTNKVVLGRSHFEQLPELKYIGILATGCNNIDLAAAREFGIDVSNIPRYGTDSVAQEIFAHILNIANAVETHSEAVRGGAWTASPDICFCLTRQTELAGKTLGLVGYGAIGKKTAQIASAFSMKVLAHTPRLEIGGSDGTALYAPLDEIFSKSDIVALCCPLTPETANIINAENIRKMKDGAWIVNTGRGGLVDERALAEALKSGKIGAAGVDVLSAEPPKADNPLLSAPNCHITPHNAWTTREARARLVKIACENVASWLEGSGKNIVNAKK